MKDSWILIAAVAALALWIYFKNRIPEKYVPEFTPGYPGPGYTPEER